MENKDSLLFWLLVFTGSFISALLSRVWFLLNNPKELKKTNDGKIHWKFEVVYGFVEALIGGAIGLGVFKLITYFELIDDIGLNVFIACIFATVAGKVFTILQNKALKIVLTLDKKTDKVLDDVEL